ncbi:hypothetical protein KUV23_08670 [Algoriphagus marincola]|uniref:Phage abortive infection protein n=1 Tax=Algoriphagus marincola TaxID=264027 RepID=A0ABS7N3Z5_9BACT|nr:hypothetical protein [Algoriphagus marincola]MBY5951042.1 hypothetical protein [Algoriphagus marincola]
MKGFCTDLKDPKFWASICAWMVPISIAVIWTVSIFHCWTRAETGTMIGAIAGPLAGLAGFLYIYVSFIQSEIESKRHEEIQVFNQFFTSLEKIRSTVYFEYWPFSETGAKAIEKQTKHKDEAFQELGYYFKTYFDFRISKCKPEVFKNSTGRDHFSKEDTNWSTLEFEKAKTLIIAVAGDIYFGQYFKVFDYIISHLRKSDLNEFLPILESSLNTFEKRFLFHYCPLMLPIEDVIFLKRNGFLSSIRWKHWSEIFKTNFWNDSKFGFISHNLEEDDEQAIVREQR